MSEIKDEAYNELCEENERLRGLLKKVDVSVEKLARAKAELERLNGEREFLAQWMILNRFSTGHGDSIASLLTELQWQIDELRRAVNHFKAEIERLKALLSEALVHVNESDSWFTATKAGVGWIEKAREAASEK